MKNFFRVFYQAFIQFRQSNPLLLASSTSFFSLFALPPILIIITSVLGYFSTDDMLSSELFKELTNFFGKDSANQIHEVFMNFKSIIPNTFASIFVFLFLIFVATTLMKLVKDSINSLWGFQPKANNKVALALFERFVSFLLLLMAGAIFLISLLSDTFLTFLSQFIKQYNPELNILLIKSINAVFSIITVSFWFMIVFKTLPNAKINWKPALVGGFVTSLLFTLGKFILGRVLVNSDIDNIFGASSSVMILLLFVFYSSLIFYYGAVFTYLYAQSIDKEIKPGYYAVKVNIKEVIEEDESDGKQIEL